MAMHVAASEQALARHVQQKKHQNPQVEEHS